MTQAKATDSTLALLKNEAMLSHALEASLHRLQIKSSIDLIAIMKFAIRNRLMDRGDIASLFKKHQKGISTIWISGWMNAKYPMDEKYVSKLAAPLLTEISKRIGARTDTIMKQSEYYVNQ